MVSVQQGFADPENYVISIDGHVLEVVEADATPVYGPVVTQVQLAPAQRYSIIVNTTQGKAGDTFWLRTATDIGGRQLKFDRSSQGVWERIPHTISTSPLFAMRIRRETQRRQLPSRPPGQRMFVATLMPGQLSMPPPLNAPAWTSYTP